MIALASALQGFWGKGIVTPPTGLTISSKTSTSVTLSWILGVSGASTDIRYSTNNTTWSSITTVTGTSGTISGLGGGTLYYFQIRTKSGSNVSAWTSSVSTTTTARNYNITSFAVTYKGRMTGNPGYHLFDYIFQGDWVDYYMVNSHSNSSSALAGNPSIIAGVLTWGNTGTLTFTISPPAGSTISGVTSRTCFVPANGPLV